MRDRFLSALFLLVACRGFAQDVNAGPVKLDPDADRMARVAKLVSQMTLEEKVSQMRNHAAAISRLGIPAYDYWNEGLHGSARSGYSTMFPQAIGMAATWDTDLLHRVATAISVEARAKHGQAVREENFDIYYGITIWSPNINIFRDPRWGRGQETYGEDPFLTSRLGVAFVSGLQGDSAKYLRTVATPKHFAVHSGPESERHKFNVDPSPKDLQETYFPAFRATVTEAHAQSLMCAYNAIDGEPACANKHLLNDVLRGAWGFDGFVTSDCGAIGDVADGHRFAKDYEQAAVASVRAGTDTSCGTEYDTLTKAVHDGLIQESELDVSVRRLFLARFRLGMFDPKAEVAYEALPIDEVDSEAHARLALQTARESMVLLKNEDGLLPLKKTVKTVAVIGPNAASLAALEGNYNAIPLHPVTPLEGLKAALGKQVKVLYAQGSVYADTLPVPVPETVLRNGAEAGLRGEYFATADFSGAPAMVRNDSHIDFDWNSANPVPGIPAKAFSVRWTGTLTVPAAGDYSFNVGVTSCSKCNPLESYAIYLDGKLLGEQKIATESNAPVAGFAVHLADTKPHALRVDYAHTASFLGAMAMLEWVAPAEVLRAEAVDAARRADVAIAFVGLSPNLEGEEMPIRVEGFSGGDRTDVKLPRTQEEMLEALAKTGKPLVVVLMNGSALGGNWAQDHAAAVLEAWYPGQAGGTAIAETLLGENNPAGRLPVTFYKSTDQLPAFDDYSMKGRTYRYLKTEPLYRFGDGMSYTKFVYADAHLSATTIAAGDPLVVKVKVTNSGRSAGDEVIEAYLTRPVAADSPVRELVGFTRAHLKAGETREVSLTIQPRQLSQVDSTGLRSIVPGSYHLNVAGHQPTTSDEGLGFAIHGTMKLPQ